MMIVNLFSGWIGEVTRKALWMEQLYLKNALPLMVLPKTNIRTHFVRVLKLVERVTVEKLPSIWCLLDTTMKSVTRDRRCLGSVL